MNKLDDACRVVLFENEIENLSSMADREEVLESGLSMIMAFSVKMYGRSE